jgi:uncharacterized membrane protein
MSDPAAPPSGEYRYLPSVLRAMLVVAGVLPWLVPVLRARLPLGDVGVALDLVFLPMCHRFPERTLELSGVLMPLCSRCAGIFAGVALGGLLAWPRVGMGAWRWVLGFAAAVMIIEVATQDLGIHPVYHPTRIATGVLLGYAMAAAAVTNIGPFKRGRVGSRYR